MKFLIYVWLQQVSDNSGYSGRVRMQTKKHTSKKEDEKKALDFRYCLTCAAG